MAKKIVDEVTIKKFNGWPSQECPLYILFACDKKSEEGYWEAGFHVTIHLTEDFDLEERLPSGFSPIDELEKCVDEKNNELILAWFDHYLPRCMELIPEAGREKFLEGFWKADEEGY